MKVQRMQTSIERTLFTAESPASYSILRYDASASSTHRNLPLFDEAEHPADTYLTVHALSECGTGFRPVRSSTGMTPCPASTQLVLVV